MKILHVSRRQFNSVSKSRHKSENIKIDSPVYNMAIYHKIVILSLTSLFKEPLK